MASRDATNGQYTTRPSGDDHEGWDQTDESEETDKSDKSGNTTKTADNQGIDTDGAQLLDRLFETPGQARNRKSLSPVKETYEKTVRKTDVKTTRSPMSPTAMKEAAEISRKLQALQEEMEALQKEASAKRLFDDDEIDEEEGDEDDGTEESDDDDDDDDKDDKGSGSDSEDKKGRRKKRGAEEKRKDFADVLEMFGDEAGERYLNELQMLQSAAVVDELQPDLKERLGSRTHIGSLSNLVAKMKEKRQKEINEVKAKLQTTGHTLFTAVKKFMVMMVVEENLSLTLAAMVMTAIMSEEKTQRCAIAITDVARQMSMVNDTDESEAQDEDCKTEGEAASSAAVREGRQRRGKSWIQELGPFQQADNEGKVEGEEGRESEGTGTSMVKDGHMLHSLPELRSEGGGDMGATGTSVEDTHTRALFEAED